MKKWLAMRAVYAVLYISMHLALRFFLERFKPLVDAYPTIILGSASIPGVLVDYLLGLNIYGIYIILYVLSSRAIEQKLNLHKPHFIARG